MLWNVRTLFHFLVKYEKILLSPLLFDGSARRLNTQKDGTIFTYLLFDCDVFLLLLWATFIQVMILGERHGKEPYFQPTNI